MLELKGVTIKYGALVAVENVDLSVGAGELVGLLGHNGAGKTTLLRAISGLEPCASGEIAFEGSSLARLRPERIAARSIAFVPQGRNIFADLSVEDNLRLAREAAGESPLTANDIFLLFPILKERRSNRAGSLSGGQQQMLALSLALARGPRLIMLDEPSTGLAPVLVRAVFATIERLHRELGVSFLIVDQNVDHVLTAVKRTYVVKAGRVVFGGSSGELRGASLWKYF